MMGSPLKGQVSFDTHGWVTFENYVNGRRGNVDLNRSHRSEFIGIVDLVTIRKFTVIMTLGNTTDVAKIPGGMKYLDRITYTYSYGGRFDLGRWVLRGDYHHDCIHLINRPELNGSTWWNSYKFQFGSRGAFYLYLPQTYSRQKDGLGRHFNMRVSVSTYREAGNTLRSGQNHSYQYEISNLLRYRLGQYGRMMAFVDLNQRLWLNRDKTEEYKGELTLNLMFRGREQFVGLYYEYHFHDTFVKDREDGLGSLGLKILF